MTRILSMKGLFLLGLIAACGIVDAVQYPPVIRVPVTFYDFHSDRSNPEFEQRHHTGHRQGMVAKYLDGNGKPMLGPEPYMNYYVKYWFRPWEQAAANDFTAPRYLPRADSQICYGEEWWLEFRQEVTFDGIEMRDHDTSFKNIVIEDSLEFKHVGNGKYEFKDSTFFPLDNRGFGNEWHHEIHKEDADVDHNYSFTMELNWSFVKVPGMVFNFRGDDDVWVFVDNKLEMDLGGIHEPLSQELHIDSIPDLENGESYSLDVFYAERHSAKSSIWITTNMLFHPPELHLYAKPDPPDEQTNPPLGIYDTIMAGEGYEVYAHVFDSSASWRPDFDEKVIWKITDSLENAVITQKGSFLKLPPQTKANREMKIEAQFISSDTTEPAATAVMHLFITPSEVHHLDILDTPEVTDYHKDDDFRQLYFSSKKDRATVYAVVRDEYGNYIRDAINPIWESTDIHVVDIVDTEGHSAVVGKKNENVGGEALVIVREGNLAPDTIEVTSEGTPSISVSPAPFTPGKTNLEEQLKRMGIYDVYGPIVNGKNGALIAINTRIPLRPDGKGSNSYGVADIFDAVGNLIVAKAPLLKASETVYGFVWEGTNNLGRVVGTGAYLVYVEATREDGTELKSRLKVGIKR